jgi:hypothetical protein
LICEYKNFKLELFSNARRIVFSRLISMYKYLVNKYMPQIYSCISYFIGIREIASLSFTDKYSLPMLKFHLKTDFNC